MAWYRGGTVAVTNGSATVTGTNTDFVSNVGVGYGFLGPDGRTIEIAAVVSATQLTLASPYQGATASGQSYSILPTTSYAIDLAIQAATLINVFGAIRDGIGQGLIPAGRLVEREQPERCVPAVDARGGEWRIDHASMMRATIPQNQTFVPPLFHAELRNGRPPEDIA